MEEQNKVNEENNKNTQRQETEEVTRREKISDGIIREMGKQGEISIKPKPVKEKDTQKKQGQRKRTKEGNI